MIDLAVRPGDLPVWRRRAWAVKIAKRRWLLGSNGGVEGRLGDLTFDSAQATVTVDQAATARLTTVDGDIVVSRVDGDAELRTVRGDIAVTEAARVIAGAGDV